MKPFLLLLWLGLVSLGANAQEAKELPDAVQTEIVYSPLVPASVRLHAKKPYKTKFFGRFKVESRSELAIHLYSQPEDKNMAIAKNVGEVGNVLGPYQLDVFQRAVGRKQWQLLNSVPVRYESKSTPPVLYGATSLWLDEPRKSSLVLILNLYDDNGIAGSFGDKVLLVFSQGWEKPAVVQAFGHGGEQSSDFSGKGAKFKRDEHGFLEVWEFYSYNPPERNYEEVYQWNGQRFVFTRKKSVY